MRTLSILSMIMALTIGAFAQNASTSKASLCVDYDRVTGEPIDVYSAWDIASDGKGSYVYLIYSQSSPIREKLTLYLDKKNESGNYIAFKTFDFNNDVSTTLKWAMFDVNFTEEGDYRLAVMGKNKEALAITYADIKFKKEEAVTTTTTEAVDEFDTYYYEYTEVAFGEDINEGVLIGESGVFNLKGNSLDLVALVENDEALQLTEIYVEVFGGANYDEEVSAESFTVADKVWTWVSVPIKVSKKGKYVVDFYTQNDVYINSGYFEIK
jgi:hypothetical protein